MHSIWWRGNIRINQPICLWVQRTLLSTRRHIHIHKTMKKYINRFYIIIAITAIINFFGITRDNVYQNVFVITFAFLFCMVATAYLMDDSKKERCTHSERKFIDWLNKVLNNV